jgi:hypothetical protein
MLIGAGMLQIEAFACGESQNTALGAGKGFQRGDHPGFPGVGESFHDLTPGVGGVQGAEAVQVLWRPVEVVENGDFW